jgi:hypothetical protein
VKKFAIILCSIVGALLVIVILAIAFAPEDETPEEEGTSSMASDELIAAVTAVAPDTDPDKIASNAENVCQEIEAGKDDTTLARNAALRFEVDEADGPALVDAIRPHCDTIRGK